MFSDLRGFTAFSDTHDLRRWCHFCGNTITGWSRSSLITGGTVDKFLGDGIMVTFGTPIIEGNEAQRAVKAAIAMQEEMAIINQKRREAGKMALEQGIGLHYGPAIIGNIGSQERMEYTAIGDTVNTASRVEGQCSELGAKILMSQSVQERLEVDYPLVAYPKRRLKGKGETMDLYALGV
jgi:adenylate cyclase